MEAFDDVTNEPLIPKLVMKARAEELKYFDEMGVYEYTTMEECKRSTSKAPISTRWIDINKGDGTKTYGRHILSCRQRIPDQAKKGSSASS